MGILKYFIIVFLLLPNISYGTTYTIGSSGDDYATFALYRAAHATDTAGDTISFRKGETFRESITATGSGTLGSPITFTSHGTGALPIIQPTTQLTSWTQVGVTNVYYATLATEPMMVMIGGVYCQPSHWPTTAGDATPTFAYPSSTSLWNDYTIIDTDVDFDPTGAVAHIFNESFRWVQCDKTVLTWNSETKTMGLSNNVGVSDPDCAMALTTRYYLTGLVSLIEENTWAWDDATDRLYVWKTGGGSPGTVEASISDSAFIALNREYITIDGLHFRQTNGAAVYISATTANRPGWIIKNSTISYAGQIGIELYTNLEGTYYSFPSIEITGNSISYVCSKPEVYGLDDQSCSGMWVVYGDDITINNNTVSSVGTYPLLPYKGIGIYNRFPTPAVSGTAGTINNNTVSNCSYSGIVNSASYSVDIKNNTVTDTCTHLFDGAAIYTWHAHGGTISGNNVSTGTASGHGIYNDDWTDGVIVERNNITGGTYGILLHNHNSGIARYNNVVAPGLMGINVSNDTIEEAIYGPSNNIESVYYNIVDCVSGGTLIGIYGMGQQASSIDVYNNTIVNCGYGIRLQDTNYKRFNNIQNNIIKDSVTYHIFIYTDDFTLLDYNLYYGTGGWRIDNSVETVFADWKTTSSQDSNSLNSDPLFTNSAGGDYTLTSSSPAISAGVNVGLSTDYLGHIVPQGAGYDIGAYEYYVSGSMTGLGFGLGGSIY